MDTERCSGSNEQWKSLRLCTTCPQLCCVCRAFSSLNIYLLTACIVSLDVRYCWCRQTALTLSAPHDAKQHADGIISPLRLVQNMALGLRTLRSRHIICRGPSPQLFLLCCRCKQQPHYYYCSRLINLRMQTLPVAAREYNSSREWAVDETAVVSLCVRFTTGPE